MLDAILGSALTYPLCIMDILCFWWLLRVRVLEVPHVIRLVLPHCKIITHTCGESLLFVSYLLFSSWSAYAHLLESEFVDALIVFFMVHEIRVSSCITTWYSKCYFQVIMFMLGILSECPI
jgi:hypothetical protein